MVVIAAIAAIAAIAVIAVIGAALVAVGASRPGHYPARDRGMPDAGPAAGTAAGVGFSSSLANLALALLTVSPAQVAIARKGNHAEAGALIESRRRRRPRQWTTRGTRSTG
ncbi:hypothetical protein J7F03_24720 [Streptomyces sp. ISL-43]|uniref:hypothetical protein n=1 Tax=Streptomyces sp. ISL-43 TaxID=2819183 RepID=UPI001BE5E562|nr:hypothetical protein [Streptomyces sp. ISL-43]MBT2450221.1 hypothetical protein [Streptomyces sp. ISL-43]